MAKSLAERLSEAKKSKADTKTKERCEKLRRVPKDKKTGIAKKYLSGSRNPAAKAAEIKRTAKLYKAGALLI